MALPSEKLSAVPAPVAVGERETRDPDDERSIHLDHGRTLTVGSDSGDEVIEIRAASGQLELRVVMGEDGPVLQLDAIKLSVDAASEIAMTCKTFSVAASDKVAVRSDGECEVISEGETRIRATRDVRVNGEKVLLNCD